MYVCILMYEQVWNYACTAPCPRLLLIARSTCPGEFPAGWPLHGVTLCSLSHKPTVRRSFNGSPASSSATWHASNAHRMQDPHAQTQPVLHSSRLQIESSKELTWTAARVGSVSALRCHLPALPPPPLPPPAHYTQKQRARGVS